MISPSAFETVLRSAESLADSSDLAEELGRTSGGLSAVPSTTVKFLKNLDKVPVFYAGILGIVIAVLLTPRRARMPRRGQRTTRARRACWRTGSGC